MEKFFINGLQVACEPFTYAYEDSPEDVEELTTFGSGKSLMDVDAYCSGLDSGQDFTLEMHIFPDEQTALDGIRLTHVARKPETFLPKKLSKTVDYPIWQE